MLSPTPAIKLNQFFSRFVVLILIFILPFSQIGAQRNTPPVVQSPFHDAIALYYALEDYKVIPVLMTDDETIAASEENAAAIFAGKKVVKYKIVESSTGKIITDNIDPVNLKTVLNSDESLYKFKEDERRDLTYTILARNTNTVDTTKRFIDSLYRENTYLFDDAKNVSVAFLSDKKNFIEDVSTKLIFSTSGGGVSPTTKIAEGAVEFLIEALNKEINEAFFVQMEKILSKIDELKILFPKTLESLQKIEITQYASSLNAMKAAFKKDINNLLSNIGNLATLKKYRDVINKFPSLTLLFAACDFIYLLKSDAIPAEILYQISTAPYIKQCGPNNYSSSIRLAALISNSLRDIRIADENKDKIAWIDQPNLNLLRDNESLFRIFMGLFAQQAKDIIFNFGNKDIFDFQKILFEEKTKVVKGHFIVYNFTGTVKKINEKIQFIEGLKKNSATTSQFAETYLQIANEVTSLSENCISILPSTKTINKLRDKIKSVKNEYLPLLVQANKVLANIEEKEYGMALYEADTLLSKIFAKHNIDSLRSLRLEIITKLDEAKKANTKDEASLQNSLEDIDTILAHSTKFEEVRKYYIKYGLFISSVASAKTSADVKEAIKAIALPTGSSRIKKAHHFSVGLNAYVGVYHAWNKQYDNVKMPKTETGITVPIGFAVNWGHILSGSLTAYGGIVDVGAIFTYKVNTDSSVKSDIQFSQLLSPSVGLVYGLPVIKKYNIPLSIGVNYQWGPKLRKIDETGNSVLPFLTRRINVFVAVDIPIINFRVSKD